MLDLRVDPHLSTSPSRQLIDAVLDAVASGAIAPAGRLPSVRSMAQTAMVNPNTVSKAYRELELLGVVVGRNGSGVFVTDDGPGVARRMRRDATLDQVRAAMEVALRAGHSPTRLRKLLDDVTRRTGKEQP